MYYVSSKEDRDGCTHKVTLATDIRYDKDGNIDFAVIFDTIYMVTLLVLRRHLTGVKVQILEECFIFYIVNIAV